MDSLAQKLSLISVGCFSGVLYPLILWCTKLWMKQEGLPNTIVGLVGICAFPTLLKPFVARCMNGLPSWRRWHKYYVSFVCAAALYASGVVGVTWATPHALGPFFFFVTLGVAGACLVDVFAEVMRVLISSKQSNPQQEKSLAYIGAGYRVGALGVKIGVSSLAVVLAWRGAFGVTAGILWVLLWLTYPLNKALPAATGIQKRQAPVRCSVAALKAKCGLLGFVFPVLVPLSDTFMRSMLSIFLLERGFSLQDVALNYGVLHVLGIGGSFAFSSFFPKLCVYRRLGALYILNIASLSTFSVLFVCTHVGLLSLCAGLTGVGQGLFLQLFRLILGRLAHKDYLVEHMAIFCALWASGAIISGGAGWVVDALGWALFLFFSLCIALLGLLAIYFMQKKSDNAL